MEPIYTAEALATGDGRNGHARLADGSIDLEMAIPTDMGGPGGGANPEQLFALGYATCYHQALKVVGRQEKADVTDSTVGARVHIGEKEGGGFQLAVALEVTIPGLDAEQAQQLADKAHQICPYSNATRGNIEVDVTVGQD